MKGRLFAAALVLGFPFFLDLAAKDLAQKALVYGEPLVVMPGFNLTLLFNSGVSFGLFPVGSSTGLTFMLLLQAVLCFGIAPSVGLDATPHHFGQYFSFCPAHCPIFLIAA